MKAKMKNNILATSLLGLAILLTLLAPTAMAQSATQSNPHEQIEGVWDSAVNITNCQTGTILASFRGLGLFNPGGGLQQMNNMSPILGKTALGSWQYLGRQHFTASFRFFRFDSTGAYTGIQKVTRDIQLDSTGNAFTGVISSTSYDVNGNVIATGCGTETATRVID